ncbi:MAG: hypothetical protein RIT81_06080 [Deltaproteobacteria bacterium]
MTAVRVTTIFIVAALHVACTEPLCDLSSGHRRTRGQFDKANVPTLLRSTAELTGTLTSEVYIESVDVNGEQAKSESGNFATWRVTVPADKLEVVPPGNMARLHARATDLCGNTYSLDTVDVPIELDSVLVTDLRVEPQLRDGACYVPAGSRAPLRVQPSAAAGSAGGVVTMSSVPQAEFSPSTVRLLAGTGGRATGETFFSASAANTYLIGASGGGAISEPRIVRVAGAPTIGAGDQTVPVGPELTVVASSLGDIASCRATATIPSVSMARIGEANLFEGSVPVTRESGDCASPEEQPIRIRFSSDAPTGASISVRCVDTYGVEGASRFLAGDPAPARAVDALDLAVSIPSGACYVPADGSARATLEASAPVDAAGNTVTFVASGATFPEADGGEATLVAENDAARARVTLTPSGPGVATVLVRAPGVASDSVNVTVASAPSFAPSDDATVPRDRDVEMLVSSLGDLSSCIATTSFPGTVAATVVGGGDLLAGPVEVTQSPQDCAAPEVVALRVRFARAAPVGAKVRIICSDTFGQSNAVELTAGQELPSVVSQLGVSVSAPGGYCDIPTNRSSYAIVDVTANGEAVGTDVTLHAQIGAFLGPNTVPLEVRPGGAGATLFFTSDMASVGIPIVASAGGRIAGPIAVRAVGAPSLTALTPTALATGQTGTVEVRTFGALASCGAVASHPTGTTVTIAGGTGADLTTGTVPVSVTPQDCTDVETLRIDVQLDATVPTGGSVTVRCSDVHGQTTPVVFTKQ